MDDRVNLALLQSRLGQLAAGDAQDRLRARIAEGDDAQLYRINPFRFAIEEGLEPAKAMELLLRASTAGVVRPEWNLVCRGCGEYAQSHPNLCDLEASFHCLACATSRTTNLDEHVEVSFTIDPEIRPIRFARPETLPLLDYFFTYKFSRNIVVRGDGARLVDYLRAGTKVMTRLAPGQTDTVDMNLDVGWVVGSPRAMITIAGSPTADVRTVTLEFDGSEFQPRPTIAPGPVRLVIRNASRATIPVLLYFTPIVTYFDYEPYLSGQQLLNHEAFRRYLGTEVVRPGTGIPVHDNTLLFTDLRGSTALYDRLGDEPAFELVSAHLESLARVVTRHAGVVVKTIGDAVMASFSRPVDAVRAALEMEVALRGLEPELLVLKVGIHRGPCLVVNVRDHVDYFGQTVNIAARVQGAATASQICVTAPVFHDEAVRALVGARGDIASEPVSLRGVGEPWLVYRIPTAAADSP